MLVGGGFVLLLLLLMIFLGSFQWWDNDDDLGVFTLLLMRCIESFSSRGSRAWLQVAFSTRHSLFPFSVVSPKSGVMQEVICPLGSVITNAPISGSMMIHQVWNKTTYSSNSSNSSIIPNFDNAFEIVQNISERLLLLVENGWRKKQKWKCQIF